MAATASEIAGDGVLEIVEGNGGGDESLEGLAAQLFKQIRESDFLEKNKPQGESLFAIAARQNEEKMRSSTTASAPKPSLFQRIADASQREPPPKPQASNAPAGKPTFQDALQAILQDLDDNTPPSKGDAPKSGSVPHVVDEEGESMEGLVGQLFSQIRAGGLEQCEPHGESFFAIAARQEEEKKKQQATGTSANGLFQKISVAAQQAPTTVEPEHVQSSAGKPTFQDALQAILQDLDDSVPHAKGEEPVRISAEKLVSSSSAAEGGESFEGLVGQLFSQIRAGGLEEFEPQGESFFAIAAQQEEEKQQRQQQATGTSSNGLFQKISTASHQAPAAGTQPSNAPSGKPSLQDALGTILQELDADAESRSGSQGGQDDGDELVAAFKAMAPTLGALFKDLAGDLEAEGGDPEV